MRAIIATDFRGHLRKLTHPLKYLNYSLPEAYSYTGSRTPYEVKLVNGKVVSCGRAGVSRAEARGQPAHRVRGHRRADLHQREEHGACAFEGNRTGAYAEKVESTITGPRTTGARVG